MEPSDKGDVIRSRFGLDFLTDTAKDVVKSVSTQDFAGAFDKGLALALDATKVLAVLGKKPDGKAQMSAIISESGLDFDKVYKIVEQLTRLNFVQLAEKDVMGNHTIQLTDLGRSFSRRVFAPWDGRMSKRSWIVLIAAVLAATTVGVAFALGRSSTGGAFNFTFTFTRGPWIWYLVLSVVFGVLVGAAEILSRYKDEPFLAMMTRPGLGYLTMNGLISAGAFGLLRYYKEKLLPGMSNDLLMTSFVAGFGAMAVMRSKLFSFKTDRGDDFAVGPDAVVSTFLKSVDRKIDRNRSASRQTIVLSEVSNIVDPSNKAVDYLITSLASYQNLSSDDKKTIVDSVRELKNQNLDPKVFMMAVLFGFLNVTGEANFSLLMTQLKTYLQALTPTPTPTLTPTPNPTPTPT